MTDDSNRNIESLTILLSAASAIEDEFERARIVATGIPSLLHCQASGIALRNEGWTAFVNGPPDGRLLQAEPMADSELDRIFYRTNPGGQATIHRSEADSSFDDPDSLFDRFQIQSLTVFPVQTLSGQLGILFIGKEQGDGLSTDEGLICQALAEMLALGIENLRLTQNLERLVDERTAELRLAEARQRALLKINNALVSNLDRGSLFESISESLREVIRFDRASVSLLDSQTGMIQVNSLTTSLESDDLLPVGMEFPLEGSAVESVFRERRSQIRSRLDRQPGVGEEVPFAKLGIQSYISVPIFTRGEPFGCLNLYSQTSDAYSQADADFAAEIGTQIALAAENMLAFEEIDRLKAQLQQENLYLREEIKTEYNFHEIVGNSKELKESLRHIEQVASTDATVLLLGETGTGKELFARAIHDMSPRRDRPLAKINCAAISAGLVESELFGHEKGAFTGALKQHIGRFEVADGGTLFLDEVGDLPMDTQVKLLRVLQENEFERVGGTKPVRVDVRIVAATNRELNAAVESGEFRSDLYFRLNVFPIEVPSLRERRSDIPLLIDYLIGKMSRKLGKSVKRLSTDALDRLIHYPWPGNIRELENVIERSLIISPGSTIEIDDLGLVEETTSRPEVSDTCSLEEVERIHILTTLERTNWVIAGANGAASLLDINPNTLRSRIKKLGLTRDKMTD